MKQFTISLLLLLLFNINIYSQLLSEHTPQEAIDCYKNQGYSVKERIHDNGVISIYATDFNQYPREQSVAYMNGVWIAETHRFLKHRRKNGSLVPYDESISEYLTFVLVYLASFNYVKITDSYYTMDVGGKEPIVLRLVEGSHSYDIVVGYKDIALKLANAIK